jgi:hypothetical protein
MCIHCMHKQVQQDVVSGLSTGSGTTSWVSYNAVYWDMGNSGLEEYAGLGEQQLPAGILCIFRIGLKRC